MTKGAAVGGGGRWRVGQSRSRTMSVAVEYNKITRRRVVRSDVVAAVDCCVVGGRWRRDECREKAIISITFFYSNDAIRHNGIYVQCKLPYLQSHRPL